MGPGASWDHSSLAQVEDRRPSRVGGEQEALKSAAVASSSILFRYLPREGDREVWGESREVISN